MQNLEMNLQYIKENEWQLHCYHLKHIIFCYISDTRIACRFRYYSICEWISQEHMEKGTLVCFTQFKVSWNSWKWKLYSVYSNLKSVETVRNKNYMYFLSFLKQNKKSILKMELKFHNDMSFVLNVLCLFACHVVSYRKGGGSSVRACACNGCGATISLSLDFWRFSALYLDWRQRLVTKFC